MTMFITVVLIEVWRINKKGRCFQNGKSISPNRRCNIIDEIKFKGGNKDTGITAIRDFTTIRDFKLIRYKSTKLPMKIPVSLLPPLNLISDFRL